MLRTDQYAYQRAARVAGFGLLLQAGLGLGLLAFGLLGPDTAMLFAAVYTLLGVLVWLSLVIIFYQHKLERLEALEHDELAAARGESASAFDQAGELNVQARRLRLMHQWFMPGMSLVLVAGLLAAAWCMWRALASIGARDDAGPAMDFTPLTGWALATCLAVAATCFIFSRFVAGMAKQNVWQNLRGGASTMVGTSLVVLAIAVGVGARFFENDRVLEIVTYAIPVYLAVLAAEVILNFILNLYRPRLAGEAPRPAFDSRLLSLLAAPDSIVRSLNEAVNYQFGFDITSSWGYQLLLRSFAWLLGFGVLVLVALSMMVVVEPQQQAIRVRHGAVVTDASGEDRVYESGLMWKLPWPLERAEVYDVGRIRRIPLTAQSVREQPLYLWEQELETQEELKPFIVRSQWSGGARGGSRRVAAEGDAVEAIAGQLALIDAQMTLHYRIRHDPGGQSLREYLRFAGEARSQRQPLDRREQALKALALREVSLALAGMDLNDVLSRGRSEIGSELGRRVQRAFDEHHAGVEVVAVTMTTLRPPGEVAKNAGELGYERHVRLKVVADAQAQADRGLTGLVGDVTRVQPIAQAIDDWDRLKRTVGDEAQETIQQRARTEQLMAEAGGFVAHLLAEASRDRWIAEMDARQKLEQAIGELPAYQAAPRLYQQRRLMLVLTQALQPIRKFVVALDPSQLNVNLDIKDLSLVYSTDFTTPDEEAMQP